MSHDAEKIGLTSSEISYLWSSYIMNSKSKYILMYGQEKAKDEEIKAVLQKAMFMSNKNLEDIEKIFMTENHPIPYGFKEDDVRVEAEKLYSDILMLHILKSFTSFGTSNYGLAVALAARTDVRSFFTESLNSTIQLLNEINDIAINKGVFIRTPRIPIPKTIEFAQSQSIMGAFIGHKRPMNCMEITHIFNASYECCINQGMLTGLAQTAGKDSLRSYFERGRKLMMEHIDTLNSILFKDNLTYPTSYDSEVSNTKDAPFSDKIAMYFAVSSITELLNAYSAAKMNTMRKDIFLTMTQLSSEIIMYIKDGTDIMIDNSWLEEHPKNVDREDLIYNNK